MRRLLPLVALVLSAGSAGADEYFAYYVKTTVKTERQVKSPSGPILVASNLVITEGPWINFSQAMEKSRDVRLYGPCRVSEPPIGPRYAACYPPHSVKLVEILSPQDEAPLEGHGGKR